MRSAEVIYCRLPEGMATSTKPISKLVMKKDTELLENGAEHQYEKSGDVDDGNNFVVEPSGGFGSDACFKLKNAVTGIYVAFSEGTLLRVGRRRLVRVVMLVMRRFFICFGGVVDVWTCCPR
jgi:hypothetical protein